MTTVIDRPTAPKRTLAVRAPTGPRTHPPHAVSLTGLRPQGIRTRTAPSVLELRDADPIEALLADLGQPATLETRRTGIERANRRNGVLRLFAPVQRVLQGVVIEAFCDQPGQPRLDPRRIDSAGFVLRRLQGGQRLAWLHEGPKAFGWEAVDEEQDPEADRRQLDASLGHPALDARTPAMRRLRNAGSARLASATGAVSEGVQPLFVAPPDVCVRAGRTLMFGTLSFPADERSESAASMPAYGQTAADRDDLASHLSPFLRAHASASAVPELGGSTITSKRLTEDHRSDGLRTLVEQLHMEFDAFDGTGAASDTLRSALAALKIEFDTRDGSGTVRTERVDAWPFLQQAKALLFDRTDGGGALAVPQRFAVLGTTEASRLFDALLAQLSQRYVQVVAAGSRYEADGTDVSYVLRAFVRLKPEHPGCAPSLLWSGYSEPFTLAAWHESAGVPVPVVPLPDLMNRDTLRALKPNVAFRMPAKLAGLLRSDAKKLAEGEGTPLDLKVDWICSFSIPIITLCAFIVLNIFLQLLNIIFWWLPFLKICIPVPKGKGPSP